MHAKTKGPTQKRLNDRDNRRLSEEKMKKETRQRTVYNFQEI